MAAGVSSQGDMGTIDLLFGVCAGVVVYAYAAYPLIIWIVACFHAGAVIPSVRRPRSVSVLLAVHNEQATIAARMAELTSALAASNHPGELVVVVDGSTDRTAEL